MQWTYYSTLDIPSTATSADIRAAYLQQVDRLHAGVLPASLAPEMERAYATLGNPSRRLSYDADLAARRAAPLTSLASSRSATLLAGMVAGALLSGAVAFTLLLPGHAARSHPSPTSAAVRAPAATTSQLPTAADTTTAPQTPEQATVAAAPAAPADSPAPADDSSPTPDAAPSGPPAVVAVPHVPAAAHPAAVAPVPVPANAQQRRPSVRAPANTVSLLPAPAYIYPDLGASADAAAGQPQDATITEAPIAPSGTGPPVAALSSPYGGSRIALRVPGWYCSDASGGQIFVAAGGSLPDGVSC